MQLYDFVTVAIVINQINNRVWLSLVLVILMVVLSVKLISDHHSRLFLYISFLFAHCIWFEPKVFQILIPLYSQGTKIRGSCDRKLWLNYADFAPNMGQLNFGLNGQLLCL
jgi:hypothetical protein